VPLATSLDHAGPMARTLADCAPLLAAMAGADQGRPGSALAAAPPAALPRARAGARPLAGIRLALSPRVPEALDADVAEGLDAAIAHCRALGALLVEPPPIALAIGDDFLAVLRSELIVYHRRFDARRELYRPSLREWVEGAEADPVSAERYVAAQARRRETTAHFEGWLAEHRISALLEPTVPCVAPLRGDGYDHAGSDIALISLTHAWDWTGSPVVALPAGLGGRSGLPVGVSLVGPAASDWHLLEIGIQLQGALGIPAF
jgi:aspartyl-tRNA(Asn)/glutamyl-tRNA(Gln) amidotransferase subunit A